MTTAISLPLLAAGFPATAGAACRSGLVWDRRHFPSSEVAGLMPGAALRQGFTGDITSLWRDALRGFWHDAEGELHGLTDRRALLCLEQLGRDQGQRVTRRATIPGRPGLAYWTMAPIRGGERRA